MTLSEKIIEDIKTAMKSKDQDQLLVLRGLNSAIKNKLIDRKEQDSTIEVLSEEDSLSVILSEAKKRKDITSSNAIKVLMNSMFGVLANPVFRFHNNDIANAITHFGQHLIKLTAKRIEEHGYEVIYGDTDSIFINLAVEDEKEANKIGFDIQEETNTFFKKHISHFRFGPLKQIFGR